MNRQTFGRIGERTAEEYLCRKGYRIITANYRAEGGEIDLVAKKGRTLVFVEVKAKSSTCRGDPASHFGGRKAAALRRAARFFVKTAGEGGRIRVKLFGIPFRARYNRTRFDLLELIVKDGKPKRLVHTKGVLNTEN